MQEYYGAPTNNYTAVVMYFNNRCRYVHAQSRGVEASRPIKLECSAKLVLDIAFLGKYYIKPEGGVPYLNSHLCPIPLLAEV